MKRIFTISLAFILCTTLCLSQKTIRVPQDSATIQAAINGAANGDTVLVAEGTYSVNLVISKRIVLASLFIRDGAPSRITNTILDGSAPTRVDTGATITCVPGSDTTTVITGFTITGGKGNKHVYAPPGFWIEGGGIDVMSGGATIRHNIVKNNIITSVNDSISTAGICSVTLQPNLGISRVIIEDNVITNNSLISNRYSEGGGIGIYDSRARIARNKILNNSAGFTGGIAVANFTVVDTVYIENNLIQGNVAAVNIAGITFAGNTARGVIRNNTIIDNIAYNSLGGIGIGYGAFVVIDGNYIARNVGGNQGGIYFWSTNKRSIVCNNIISGNMGNGIATNLSSSAIAVNNTIVGNTRYGLENIYGYLYAMNNIVKNPGTEIGGTVYASYNLIEGGYTGTLNIDGDPLFVPGDTLYRLSDSSPCIGAGAPSANIFGFMLYAPAGDFLGAVRPQPSGSSPDLGAIENPLGKPDGVKELNLNLPISFTVPQNYPNPFNPSTTIRYALPTSATVQLTIHDVLGREIATLVDEKQSAGWKEVQWDAAKMASGVYFYKLTAGNFVQTRRMVLLK